MQEQKGSSSPSISTLSIVQMNDISASYDSKNYVLKNIQMSITRGSNYAIVGQSGSGKSTLLKLINGMMNPSRGKIMVDYKIPNTSDKKCISINWEPCPSHTGQRPSFTLNEKRRLENPRCFASGIEAKEVADRFKNFCISCRI